MHWGKGTSIWSSGPYPDLKGSPLMPATVTSYLLLEVISAWHLQGTPQLQCLGEACWPSQTPQCTPVPGVQ